MHCDKEQIITWLNGQMSEDDRRTFESHISLCELCREELNTSRKVYELMSRIPVPEPSVNLRARFQGMLDAYKQSHEENYFTWKKFLNKIEEFWILQPKLQLVYSVFLLFIGLGIGYFLSRANNEDQTQINELTAQVDEMRQMMMLAMFENPSASKRLQAVNYTNEISDVNEKVINVLLKTLNEDPNVNVRLATLNALLKFSYVTRVREGLVHSIVEQESPLVISAMADAMVEIQEKSSVESLKQLLNKENLNSSVKSKLEESIYQLI
jgi:uncharacterized protein YneF (UPF0154 family)